MTNKTGILILTVLLACMAFSCKKMNADFPPDAGRPAQMNVVNATADTLNIFQNGNRFNNISSFYPAGSLGYLQVLAGEQQYQVKKDGTPNVLLSLPMALDTLGVYSFFIAGNSADRVFLTKDVFLANNDIEIRFVNSTPGKSFDIKIGSNFNYSNRAFKSVTGFVKMTAGKNHYELYETGNAVPLAQGDIVLAEQRVYTLFTKGTATGTGDNALGVKLITNR
ncbi:DUF4397 domain-containing protein [Mucilaginibacter calamicampi]|uniref:DUF4397 domain-containing protein n=1 Tax=Mucilaginibacter calamicampi TaxID=1302352 RepID=A0ABW2YWH6_9SPHI